MKLTRLDKPLHYRSAIVMAMATDTWILFRVGSASFVLHILIDTFYRWRIAKK